MTHLVKSLFDKARNFIKYGVVSYTNGDSANTPVAQVTSHGIAANAQRIMPYGVYGEPPPGTKCILLQMQGDTEKKAFIAFPQSKRFKTSAAGEMMYGNIQIGTYIKFLNNGDIEISSIKDTPQNITVTGKNLTLNITESCIINSKNSTINATEDCTVNANNINIQADNDCNIAAKNITMIAENNIAMEGNDISFTCGTAVSHLGTNGNFEITADKFLAHVNEVNLGNGGARIARLGDQVTIGSDVGTITSAGTNTSI